MKFRIGDTVLADTIDGVVLCKVVGYNEMGAVTLEPVNDNVEWDKCWLKPEFCKLVKAAPRLKAIQ